MLKYLEIIRFSLNSKHLPILKNKIQYNNLALFSRQLNNKMPRHQYPNVRRDDTILENYHGVDVITILKLNHYIFFLLRKDIF